MNFLCIQQQHDLCGFLYADDRLSLIYTKSAILKVVTTESSVGLSW
jgi:hypothetical protein